MATPATGNVEQIISVKFDARQAVSGLTSLNSQIAQNTKELSDMAKAGEKGTKAYADLEQETKSLKTQKRDLSQMVQNEIKQQTTLDGSLRSLRAELSNLTKRYDALSKAERENVDVGVKLKNQINQVTTEIKRAEEGTQRYYRNVGNYQNAILNALGINGRFGQSIMGLTNMQGGFSGAMTAMGTSVKAFGASLMALMSNPVFLAIAGIAGVGMAFKWFYDYNEGLAEATRLTKEFTGYVGDDLMAMRNSIQATAEVMDKEFVDVLKTADSLMQNFKIDGETAMNIINQGFAAGGDLNGDMLDKIQRLAPAFKNAGMSAEQLVALIARTRSGIFTDQGLDAIAMGTSRIRQFSDNMKKALQGIGIDAEDMGRKLKTGELSPFAALTDISAKLQEISPNTQEYGNVVNAVFGKAGKTLSTEMVQGLADMSTSLDEAQAKTGQYGELLLENIKTEEDLNNATSALFDLTNKGWEEIKQQAIIYAKKALVAVVKGLIDVANWFIKLYNSSLPVRAAVNMIATQFKVLWSVVKFAFNNIINGFKTIGRGISAVVNGFSQAGNAIKAFGKGVALIFKGISKMSWELIEQGWNTISGGMKNAAISAFDGLKEVVTSGAADWADAAGKFGNEVGNAVMDGIKNTMNDQWNEIKIPAFAGGGNNTKDLYLDDDKDKDKIRDNSSRNRSGGRSGGSRNRGGSNRTSRNSGGSNRNRGAGNRRTGGSTKRGKTDAEKAEEDYQKRIDDLIKKGTELEMKALEESAKKTEAKAEELAEKQKEALVKMYGGEDYLKARLAAATTDADKKRWESALKFYQQMEKQIEEDEKNNKKIIKENADKEEEERKKRAAEIAKQITQIYLETSKDGSEDQLAFQKDLLDKEEEQELAAVKDSEELKNAIILKYQQKREQLEKEHEQKRLQQAQTYAEMMMAGTEEHEQANLDWRLKSLQHQLELELLQYEDNEEMKAAIRAKYQQLEKQAREEHTQAVIAIEQQKYEAIASFAGGMSQILEKISGDNKDAAKAAKALALGEILINQAVAISNAVKAGSNASNPWQMIAQIAASVTAVVVAMVDAFASFNKAKFATGGYISGAGTSTSDSIPVRVSNGESIMNANTTAMFGGLLSSLNQLGGGVPIQVQETASSVRGEDMLARAVARGVAMLPNPVVSVEDINRGQRQVEVMNERATL